MRPMHHCPLPMRPPMMACREVSVVPPWLRRHAAVWLPSKGGNVNVPQVMGGLPPRRADFWRRQTTRQRLPRSHVAPPISNAIISAAMGGHRTNTAVAQQRPMAVGPLFPAVGGQTRPLMAARTQAMASRSRLVITTTTATTTLPTTFPSTRRRDTAGHPRVSTHRAPPQQLQRLIIAATRRRSTPSTATTISNNSSPTISIIISTPTEPTALVIGAAMGRAL